MFWGYFLIWMCGPITAERAVYGMYTDGISCNLRMDSSWLFVILWSGIYYISYKSILSCLVKIQKLSL